MEDSSIELRAEKEKQLKSEFTICNKNLNTCLTSKHEEVARILAIYRTVSDLISSNKAALNKMHRNLTQCKSLLSCKSAELKRLWIDLVEQRCTLEYIELLDQVRSTPDMVSNLIQVKSWPEATELLKNANFLVETRLRTIPALQTTKNELVLKKNQLSDNLNEEFIHLTFTKPLLYNKELIGSRPSQQHIMHEYKNYFSLPLSNWRRILIDYPKIDSSILKDTAKMRALVQELRQQQASDPHAVIDVHDWPHTLVTIIHCLNLLDRLFDSLGNYKISYFNPAKTNCHDSNEKPVEKPEFLITCTSGLLRDIHHYVTKEAVRFVDSTFIPEAQSSEKLSINVVGQNRFLCLMEVLFNSMFCTACALNLCFRAIREGQPSSRSKLPKEFLSHEMTAYVWATVQEEIKLVLTAYLTPSESSSEFLSSEDWDSTSIDLMSYLGRKRTNLFGFGGGQQQGPGQQNSDSIAQVISSTIDATSQRMQSAMTSLLVPNHANPAPPNIFSFANTAHALNMSDYVRQKPDREDDSNNPRLQRIITNSSNQRSLDASKIVNFGSNQYILVCKASVFLLCCVYSNLVNFIDAIEKELQASDDPTALLNMGSKRTTSSQQNSVPMAPCKLRIFLKSFVESNFLPFVRHKFDSCLTAALSGNYLEKVTVKAHERELGISRPILTVVVEINSLLAEIRYMMSCMPDYAKHFFEIFRDLVAKFIAFSKETFSQLAKQQNGDKCVPSADWSNDPDLSRFWKKFPVWQRMAVADIRIATSMNMMHSPHRKSMVDAKSEGIESQNEGFSRSSTISIALALQPSKLKSMESQFSLAAEGVGIPQDRRRSSMSVLFGTGMPLNRLNNPSRKHDDVMRISEVIFEREATRLAAKETEQLLHLISNEFGFSGRDKNKVETALETMQGPGPHKHLARMHESLCWLSNRLHDFETWLDEFSKKQKPMDNLAAAKKVAAPTRKRAETMAPRLEDTGFVGLLNLIRGSMLDLSLLADTCLLTVYLDLRIQAYNTFGWLPNSVNYYCQMDEVTIDPPVVSFLDYLEQMQSSLASAFSQHKYTFIFDGLADFISQLLLRLIPKIQRMNGNGNKKMCRNIYRLQQVMAALMENQESDLARVKQLFELFYLTPEAVINRVMEQGAAFNPKVYEDLLNLYQRSHPTHNHEKTDACIAKLKEVLDASN
ncbi:Exocyst complex component 4 [Cichlidogyrus casuarinus]|uniref:Exocyst complex component Sec8 n=1 Tax=Cichlidogyrus casuarinus TaxID=1844966 RepID=A0ABD2QHS6_9PLAT